MSMMSKKQMAAPSSPLPATVVEKYKMSIPLSAKTERMSR